MNDLPTAPPAVAAHPKEREHCKILAILHFVYGALAIAAIGAVFLHYSLMSSMLDFQDSMMSDPDIQSELQEVEFENFMSLYSRIMMSIYLGTGFFLLLTGILNILSGVGLLKFRWKGLIYITSGLNCLSIPFGLTLAVFTFLNLAKPEVSRLFERWES